MVGLRGETEDDVCVAPATALDALSTPNAAMQAETTSQACSATRWGLSELIRRAWMARTGASKKKMDETKLLLSHEGKLCVAVGLNVWENEINFKLSSMILYRLHKIFETPNGTFRNRHKAQTNFARPVLYRCILKI